VPGLDLGIPGLVDAVEIGRGGFGVVYRAHETQFDRDVAVKVLTVADVTDERELRAFERERRLLGRVSEHPNIVTIYSAGLTGDRRPYLVLPFVPGGSVADKVEAHGPLGSLEARRIASAVAAALAFAHELGVLHLDVKPANVLINRFGEYLLADFGIARLSQAGTAALMTSTIAATPAFAAPEILDLSEPTGAADIYSLGATLYTVLTGRPPYPMAEGEGLLTYLARIATTAPEPLSGDVDPALASAVAAAMARDPGERPTAAQLAELFAPASQPTTSERALAGGIDGHHGGPPPAGLAGGEAVAGGGDHTVVARASPDQWPIRATTGTATAADGTGAHTAGASRGRRRRWLAALGVPLLLVAAAVTALALLDRGSPAVPRLAWIFESGSALASRPAVADATVVFGTQRTRLVQAVDADTGEAVWSFETGDSVISDPAIAGGVVYIGGGDGSVYALRLDSGSLVWSSDAAEAPVGGGVAVAPDLGLVFVGAQNGRLLALRATDGTPAWVFETGGEINGTPALATRDGRPVVVIGGTDGYLRLIGAETGQEVAPPVEIGAVWFSSPLVVPGSGGAADQVWIGSSANRLWAIDVETLEATSWNTTANVGTRPVLLANGLVVAGTDDGYLFAISRTSMGEVWRVSFGGEQIKGSPVEHAGRVYFGSHDRAVVAVDADTGDEVWRYTGQAIFGLSGPVVDGDRLFIGSDDGRLYRFDLPA
jgi:outer membrane protein assembly factor BamB